MDTEKALTAARKTCMQCGEEVELLRFRCPRCSSEMFDPTATGTDYELVEMARGRQQRSQQHVDQGGRLFQQGAADEAVREFERAIEANPWNATAYGNIGVVHLRRDQPAEALSWFRRALEADPNVPGAKEMAEQAKSRLG